MTPETPVTEIKTGRPVQQALAAAGVVTLRDLTGWSEKELLALHGVGSKGIRVLREALAECGLAFKR